MRVAIKNLVAFAAALRAQASRENQEIVTDFGSNLKLVQTRQAIFAHAEASLYESNKVQKRKQDSDFMPCEVQVAFFGFSTALGPLTEDLVEDLAGDDAEHVRAVCDCAYSSVMLAWLSGTLGMRLGSELLQRGVEKEPDVDLAPVNYQKWSDRISDGFAAGRAKSAVRRQLLRVVGAAETTPQNLVQVVGVMWQRAGFRPTSIGIDAFCGGMQALPLSERFALGHANLGVSSVLGRRMSAVASLCDITLGPIDKETLGALDNHPTFRNELIKALKDCTRVTNDVRVVLDLEPGVQPGLVLRTALPGIFGQQKHDNRLGRRSYLGAQKNKIRLKWFCLSAQRCA